MAFALMERARLSLTPPEGRYINPNLRDLGCGVGLLAWGDAWRAGVAGPVLLATGG